MKLLSIDIENFRGIREAKLNGFKRVNIFLGKNNASKTSVLEAIFLNIGITNSQLPININLFRGLAHTVDDDFRLIFRNLDYAYHPKFKSKFDQNSHTRTLEIRPIFSTSSEIINKEIETSISTNIDTRIESGRVNGLELESTIKEYQKKVINLKSKVISAAGSLEGELPKRYKETLTGVFLSHTFVYGKLSERLENMIVNKSEISVVEILNQVDSSIKSITLGTKGLIYIDIGIDRLIPLNIAGDGIKNILAILVSIADMKDGIVLIDEIENGLHHTSQNILLKAIFIMAEHYNVQIFATTHDYEILKYLQQVLAEDDLKKFQDDTMVFTLRMLAKQTLKAYPYDFNSLSHAIEHEIEIR
ncbi:MAG: AAA family ATPase [Saprospiraceae bacterium]